MGGKDQKSVMSCLQHWLDTCQDFQDIVMCEGNRPKSFGEGAIMGDRKTKTIISSTNGQTNCRQTANGAYNLEVPDVPSPSNQRKLSYVSTKQSLSV